MHGLLKRGLVFLNFVIQVELFYILSLIDLFKYLLLSNYIKKWALSNKLHKSSGLFLLRNADTFPSRPTC